MIQSSFHIVTPLGTKKNGVIIKILYDVTKERFFLISLLVTWTNANVLIGRDVTISGVTIEGDDCISFILKKCFPVKIVRIEQLPNLKSLGR